MTVPAPRRRRFLGLYLALALAGLTLIALWPATRNDFVEFDDLSYVNDNPHVVGGLSEANVRWALTTTEMGNWHPLTWLSLMLDAHVWGPKNAAGFHLTNLILHLANVLVLFAVLGRLTGAPWRSAAVAALFAVHPLNVEAVAWVAERKGLLAAFFALLALLAYVRYAHSGSWLAYLAVVLAFALSLMAKAVTVTLPAVFLLLDFWPLRRTALLPGEGTSAAPVSWRRLLGEKVPLLALSLGFSVLAPLAQRDVGALRSVEQRSLPSRVANSMVNPIEYLRKLVWPSDLAVFYPHVERPLLAPEVLASALALIALTALALRTWRRGPYGLVGWLWYLGLLLPVAGLVPVGGHSLADRYVYLPAIGLFVVVVWSVTDLLAGVRLRSLALPLAAAVLIGCVVLTRAQLEHWHDPVTLWEQALRVTRDNHRAYHNLGVHYLNTGRVDEAIENLTEAVRLRPEKADWHVHLGGALLRQGKIDEAQAQLLEAQRLQPDLATAANDLGVVLERQGDLPGAAKQFHRAVELDPAQALFRGNEERLRLRLAQHSAATP
jgi:hypothetical protein